MGATESDSKKPTRLLASGGKGPRCMGNTDWMQCDIFGSRLCWEAYDKAGREGAKRNSLLGTSLAWPSFSRYVLPSQRLWLVSPRPGKLSAPYSWMVLTAAVGLMLSDPFLSQVSPENSHLAFKLPLKRVTSPLISEVENSSER